MALAPLCNKWLLHTKLEVVCTQPGMEVQLSKANLEKKQIFILMHKLAKKWALCFVYISSPANGPNTILSAILW